MNHFALPRHCCPQSELQLSISSGLMGCTCVGTTAGQAEIVAVDGSCQLNNMRKYWLIALDLGKYVRPLFLVKLAGGGYRCLCFSDPFTKATLLVCKPCQPRPIHTSASQLQFINHLLCFRWICLIHYSRVLKSIVLTKQWHVCTVTA